MGKLKETAMRCGGAEKLRWIDIDFEMHTITLNSPEKGFNARMWKVDTSSIAMLKALPKKNPQSFWRKLNGFYESTFD